MKTGSHLFLFTLLWLFYGIHSSKMSAQDDPMINKLSTYQTGIFDEGAAEIAAFDPATARIFFTNADDNSVQIIDISDPMNPTDVGKIDLATYGGGVNSVDISGGIVAVAVEAENKTQDGSVVFFNTNGDFINEVTVGALPDMLTFTNDGQKVIVANEGEPNDGYTVDPAGSISIIDLAGGPENASVTEAGFEAFNDKKESLINKGVRIFGPNASVAQDLEPEYIALTSNDALAYVALQENNAFAVVDIENATVLDILPLGYKDHNSGSPTLQQYVLNDLVADWPELGTPTYFGGQPPVSLGGFSALYFDPTESDSENYVFYTVPDRGPNLAAVNKGAVFSPAAPGEETPANLRPFKLPEYQARIVKFTLNLTSGMVTLDDQIMLNQTNQNDEIQPVSGRTNLPGIDEIPVVPDTIFPAEASGSDYQVVDWVDTSTLIGYRELRYDVVGGDFEGILKDKDGNFWLCDENRPSIYQFDPTGMLMNRYVPEGTGDLLLPIIGFSFEGAYGPEVLPAVYSNKRANRGFEAIAYDADANIIYAFIQSPVETPDNSVRNNSDIIRILGIDPDGTPVSEYVYLLERNRDAGHGLKRTDKIGDAVYIGDGKFLVIERDSSVPEDGETGHKYIYEIDLKGATNILDFPISAKMESSGPDDPTLEMLSADELISEGIQPVYKRKILNLPSIGYHPSDKAEGISLLPDGSIAVLNDNDFGLAGAGVTDNSVLGIISFGENYGMDASNRDDGINIAQHPTLGMYQPDAIATFEHEGQTYIISANEGDARDYLGFSEEDRVSGLSLDEDEFSNTSELQDDANLGRLKTTTANGDIDGDGNYDRIFSYGGRSFSIFDQFGNLVYDSGDELEKITAELLPEDFNSTNDENDSFDDRSDDKGPEPEAVEVFEVGGKRWAVIGLERVSGMALFDISDPKAPRYVTYISNRNFDVAIDSEAAGDVGVEDIRFVSAEESPNGIPLLITANEVSGTVSIYALDVPTDVEDEIIDRSDWRIYPNPVFDVILTNTVSDFSVYSLTGQLLLQKANTQRIEVNTLPKGTYLLKDEQRNVSKLFVKE